MPPTTCHRYRVPVDAISSFLQVLDPLESAIVTYRGGQDEHYEVELDFDVDVLADGVTRIG